MLKIYIYIYIYIYIHTYLNFVTVSAEVNFRFPWCGEYDSLFYVGNKVSTGTFNSLLVGGFPAQ